MQWQQPQVLLLLPVLLLGLWWAARRRARPREQLWPSLLIWRRVLEQSGPAAAAAAGRRPPLGPLVLGGGAVVLLVLAAAGPRVRVPDGQQPRLGLLIDTSPSTQARAAGGGTRRQALQALGRAVQALVPPARLLASEVGETAGELAALGAGGLEPLARAALALRSRGAQVVVVVADRVLEPPWEPGPDAPGWVSLVPAAPALPNAGIVRAGARPAGQALAVLLAVGADSPPGSEPVAAVELRLQAPGQPERVLARAPAARFARPAAVHLELVPPPAGPFAIAVRPLGADGTALGDGLSADDRVEWEPPGAPVRLWARPGLQALPLLVRRALVAAGGSWAGAAATAEVEVDFAAPAGAAAAPPAGGEPGGAALRARLLLAPAAGAGPPAGALVLRPGPPLWYTDPAGLELPLAPAPPPAELRALLVDAHGRAVAGAREGLGERLFWIGVPLGEPALAAAWSAHPSLPVMLAEALGWLAGREPTAAGWRARGLLDARESAEAVGGAPQGGLAQVRAALEAARAGAARAPRPLASALAALAAVLALLGWREGARQALRRAGASARAAGRAAPGYHPARPGS
ncbi:MAG: hypothetical protein KatS3mg102_1106 [Planctomycetota bacterium]|nr:MAG: hypothetical protein KatS3mg102_1106 [Planctomycetota bacterium]